MIKTLNKLEIEGDFLNLIKEATKTPLAGMAQWIDRQSGNQKVTCLIPSQGTCLSCCQVPSWGQERGMMFLSLPFSLPSPLPKNKILKKNTHS